MEETNFCLCVDCSKDIYLKNYVKVNARKEGKCTICLSEKPVIYLLSDPFLLTFCRFLIRYHIPEHEYNTHWGGKNLPDQFYSDNPIISHLFSDINLDDRELDVERFLYTLFELDDDKNVIKLYYGHDEVAGEGLFPDAIKYEMSTIWYKYLEDLRTKNYYLLETDAKEMFTKLLEDFKCEFPVDSSLFRGRKGYKLKSEKVFISSFNKKVPYEDIELSAPPIFKTKAGRANRHGVSYLYLASDIETVISELRPHKGHYISCGEFVSNKKIILADLRFIDLTKYFRDKDQLEIFKLLRELSFELSNPILPEEQEYYLVTQFISDIIRQIGFDGILFNSSVSNGYNLVAFYSNNFTYKVDSSELIKVTGVNFLYKKTEYVQDGFYDTLLEK